MKKFIILILATGLLAAGCNQASTNQTPSQAQSQQTTQNNFDLQSQCADKAAKFFANRGYKGSDEFNYQNHFNSKLNKCFILITSYTASGDFVTIDLYDALEGSHYAEYNGHNVCDPTILATTHQNPDKCNVDSGSIWLDGNDTKNPADIVVGFRGLANGGGAGDQNTQKQFMEQVQPFMND